MKNFHKITAFVLLLTTSSIMMGCSGGSSPTGDVSSTDNTTPSTTTSTTTSTTSTSTTSTSSPTTTSNPSDSNSATTIGQGKLSIHLTDAPAEYEAVYVTISEVHVHRADINDSNESNETDGDAEGWIVVATPNSTYDLLELQNGITTFMGEDLIPSGDYTQLRLILGATPDTALNILGNPHPEAQYIILDDDQAYALKVPSNTVKYNHNFTIIDGGDVDMVIDFDANKSIHSAGNKWLLKPVLKVSTELQ